MHSRAQARKLAKAGMVASLAAVTLTGVIRRKGLRKLHVATGVALIGFSIWHHSLYPSSAPKK